MNRKFAISYPIRSSSKPIAYHLVKDFNLVVNIIQANIDQERATGAMVLEVSGKEGDIHSAIDFLKIQQISVHEFEKKVTFSQDRCMNCALCVGGCPSGALSVERGSSWQVSYQIDQCIACGFCVGLCPVNALIMKMEST